MGTHLNCIDKSMQFKWVPITYAFIIRQKVHWLCSEYEIAWLCAYRDMCGNEVEYGILFLHENKHCGYSLELHYWSYSNECIFIEK